MTLTAGVLIWFIELLALAALSSSSKGARFGLVLAVLLLFTPVFVVAPGLARGLLACFFGATFFRALDLARTDPIVRFRARAAYLFAYFDVRQVRPSSGRRPLEDFASLVAASAALAAAIAVVKQVPPTGAWLLVRWLSGGIGLLALAEMATACHGLATSAVGLSVPPLFRSPRLANSLVDFWARRWNVPASEALRRYCYMPFARRSPSLALLTTFVVSGVGHAFIAALALRSRSLGAACALFFILQPFLIAGERWLRVSRWSSAAARAWTLVGLAVTSPLVVEPVLRMAELAWGSPTEILRPTAAALAFCATVSILTSIAALASRPETGCSAASPRDG